MSGDLHCHTRLSDGSMGIEEIIALAKGRGIETIAITDHDCLAGTVRGKIIGERNGVKVIPGVELSAVDGETGKYVHILCYLPEFPDRLEGICHQNTTVRKRVSQFMMIKVAQKYSVTSDLIKRCATGSTTLCKQHIMHAFIECGLADSFYGDMYHELFSPESEKNILAKAAFVDVLDVLNAIHEAGGIAVLAHPKLYDSFELIERLIPHGLDGIEVWHPTADEETVTKLIALAKKNKLLMTGGSDFHGLYNRSPVTIGSFVTPDQQLAELMSYKARQKRLIKKNSTSHMG